MPETATTTTTPETRSRQPPASVTRITDAKGATSTGRTTTGDNGGGHNLTNKGKKPQPAATPTATPVAKALGPSGYRQKYGTTNEAIVKAIRDDAKANEWELTLSDGELLAVIGWTYTPWSAIAKVRSSLSA